jgi:hypothetical protein
LQAGSFLTSALFALGNSAHRNQCIAKKMGGVGWRKQNKENKTWLSDTLCNRLSFSQKMRLKVRNAAQSQKKEAQKSKIIKKNT